MKEHDLGDRERQPDITPAHPQRGPTTETGQPDDKAGIGREVGDLEDPNAEDEGALPGRVGGGLAGG